MWPHIGALILLCAGLVLNFIRGGFSKEEKAKT
jgi:hypothetical protein